jgi:hypothetical protein
LAEASGGDVRLDRRQDGRPGTVAVLELPIAAPRVSDEA